MRLFNSIKGGSSSTFSSVNTSAFTTSHSSSQPPFHSNMKFNVLTVASTILISATVASSQTPGWPTDWFKALPDCAIDCAVQAANSVGCKMYVLKHMHRSLHALRIDHSS